MALADVLERMRAKEAELRAELEYAERSFASAASMYGSELAGGDSESWAISNQLDKIVKQREILEECERGTLNVGPGIDEVDRHEVGILVRLTEELNKKLEAVKERIERRRIARELIGS